MSTFKIHPFDLSYEEIANHRVTTISFIINNNREHFLNKFTQQDPLG